MAGVSGYFPSMLSAYVRSNRSAPAYAAPTFWPAVPSTDFVGLRACLEDRAPTYPAYTATDERDLACRA